MTSAPGDPGAKGRSGDSGRTLAAFLLWPVFTSLGLMLLAIATGMVAEQTGQGYREAARTVAEWMTPPRGAEDFDTSPGFGFLAVMGAIAIGLAFSLLRGGVKDLAVSSRRIIFGIAVGVLVSTLALSAVIVWNMLSGRVTFEMFLLLASAWLVTLLTFLVNFTRPTADRLRDAHREYEKYRRAAELLGLPVHQIRTSRKIRQSIPPARKRNAHLLFWSAPVCVASLLFLGLLFDFKGLGFHDTAIAVAVFVWAAAVLMQFGWFVTAGHPRRDPGTWLVSVFVSVFSIPLLALGAAAAAVAHSWGFLAAIVLVAVGFILALLVPPITEKIWFLLEIRRAATARSLSQVDEWLQKVRAEHDAEQEELAPQRRETQSVEDTRQPLIRIELFRRRSRPPAAS